MSEEKKQHDPIWLYHAKDAPEGKLFGPDDELPKGKDWAESPEKLKKAK